MTQQTAGWFGRRYAKLLGVEIADEVLNADEEIDLADEVTRNWWIEYYKELRAISTNSDPEDVGRFLQKHFNDRVGDLADDELTECAEAFADKIWRAQM